MSEDMRERYAETLRKVFDYQIIAEWICCEPVRPHHDLCAKGQTAREMVGSLLADDQARGGLPSPILDALIAVRDEEMERLQGELIVARNRIKALEGTEVELLARAEQAEAAIERVRALHVEASSNGGPLCEHCTDWAGIAVGYPCPTLRTLDAPETLGGES